VSPSEDSGLEHREAVVPPAVPETDRIAYRQYLLDLDTKAQEAYDRTVLALSGGALGVSFAFVKDFLRDAPAQRPGLLHVAWFCWVASLAVALAGNYLSTRAMRKALEQVDRGTFVNEEPGGAYAFVLSGLNAASGLLFLGGLLVMGWFVSLNVR
jgi:hypothetical protein